MKLNFIWKEKPYQYQTGYTLYLNRIPVANYTWNSTRSKAHTNEDDWVGSTLLPGIRMDKIVSSSQDDIKQRLEKIVMNWFEEALKGGD